MPKPGLTTLAVVASLWLTTATGLAAPGTQDQAEPLRLAFSWPGNVGPLNPHLYTPNQMFAQAMVYEPLVKYQPDGTIAPWLATAWRQSDDGLSHVFELRRDVVFSNGEPFDAAAVVANFNAVLANRDRHGWLELANQIKLVEAVDDHRVRITLNNPYYPLLAELALPRPFRFIAPSQFIDGGTAGGIKAPVGTGPWVHVQSRLGQDDLFIRNERYWNQRPAYDQVLVRVIADANSRVIAFETGEIDLIYGTDGAITPDNFARFQSQGQDTVTTALSEPLETRMIALNSARGVTADPAVRRAINHAIDKDAMIRAVLHGTESRADTLFAANMPYADLDLPPYGFDPGKAMRLLDEAGWLPGRDGIRQRNGQRLASDLVFVGTDAVAKSLAEIIQASLARIGMAVDLVGEEDGSVQARQRDGRFGMVFHRSWGAPYDPHALLSSMRAPSHADYQAQLGLPDKAEIDRQISAVLLTANEEERRRLYRQILTRLHDSAVYLPLTHIRAVAVARPAVGPIPFGGISAEIPFERLRPTGPVR